MKNLFSELKTAILATMALAVILGIVYPLLIWGLAQGIFPEKANGSLIKKDKKIVGSVLIAQPFTGEKFFHPRPSTIPQGHDALVSGGSNLGPLSKSLISQIEKRVRDYRRENDLPQEQLIPIDAVTSSASGLDPHISIENARLQTGRIARSRGVSQAKIRKLIELYQENRQLGIFGEKRINVLILNLELEKME